MDLRPRALFTAFCDDVGISPIFGDDLAPIGAPAFSEFGSESEFAGYTCVSSLFKKFEDEVSPDADRITFAEFQAADAACSQYVYPADISGPDLGYALTYSRLALRDWLEPPFIRELNPRSIARAAAFGPGSSANFNRPGTNLYFKIGSGPVTFTHPLLFEEWTQLCEENPTCRFAEKLRNLRWGAQLTEVGELSLVPKSFKKRRVILVEPSLNTFYQSGVGVVLESVLRRHTGISFTHQPERNARLAQAGSVNQKFATIDLKQCSDYQSLTMLRAHCPSSLVRVVEKYRTGVVAYNGEVLPPLSMISTMGNGFTFPLMTMILASVVFGVYKTLDIPFERPTLISDGNFGVFGDDIIVVKEAVPLLFKVLNCLGYVVNGEKSYETGPFRESCGSDWYNGVNVRGVYIKSLKTKQDLISVLNRLTAWGAIHDFRLLKTKKLLCSWLNGYVPYVPPDCQVTAGIILTRPPIGVRTDKNGSYRYDEFKPIPRMLKVRPQSWSKGVKLLQSVEPTGRVNSHALLKCALGGHIRNSQFALRDREPRYVLRGGVAPNWSVHSHRTLPVKGGPALQRWIAATTELEILLCLK